jgi:hypothetical protein
MIATAKKINTLQIMADDRMKLKWMPGINKEDIYFAGHIARAISKSLALNEWQAPAEVAAEYRAINNSDGFEINARPPWVSYINNSDWTRYTGIAIHSKAMAYAIKWAILGWLKGWR